MENNDTERGSISHESQGSIRRTVQVLKSSLAVKITPVGELSNESPMDNKGNASVRGYDSPLQVDMRNQFSPDNRKENPSPATKLKKIQQK